MRRHPGAGFALGSRDLDIGHLLGDFAAVRRQEELLGERLDADEFLSQLESEYRVKPEVREQRSMGFVH